MKTAKTPVYVDNAVYVYTIDYTLRCLEYICSVSSQIRRHGLSLAPLGLLIVKTLANVL